MITKDSTINELLQDERIKKLKPIEFKAFIILLEKSDSNQQIKNFSLRNQAEEWANLESTIKLTSNKNMVNSIINELKKVGLIKLSNKTIIFL